MVREVYIKKLAFVITKAEKTTDTHMRGSCLAGRLAISQTNRRSPRSPKLISIFDGGYRGFTGLLLVIKLDGLNR